MTRTAAARPGAGAIAAFFDVDNTIIRGASSFYIARGLHRRGYFNSLNIVKFAFEQLKYRVLGESKEQMDTLQENAMSIIEGWSVADMASIGEEIYDEVLALRIYPGTKAILDGHLKRGHEVWLVTASPVEVGKIIARRLGATGALGTVAERNRGFYTGKLIGGLMHGANKAKATKVLAAERGIDLSKSYAYGDSMNDVHILGEVGNPCAINPEGRLRRYAKKQEWPIQDFRGKKGTGRRGIVATTSAGTLWVILAVLRKIKRSFVAVFSRKKP